MASITDKLHESIKSTLAALQRDRLPWWRHWREIADYFLPRRYVWLMTNNEFNNANVRNRKILDATGTTAARTLASGMMNGVTSPARPWFRLRVPGSDDEESGAVRIWLDEVQRRMLLVMAESNFYNALAVVYLDLVVFGTAAMLIYDDFEEVIRCYNTALGEFYIAHDHRLQVNTYAREFSYKVNQIVDRWGEENVSTAVRDAYKRGGPHLQDSHKIAHLIEPNLEGPGRISSRFKFREYYWEAQAVEPGKVLEIRGYIELPGVFPRWETLGNSSYGSSPCMDALPDVIQLQFETKAKAQSLEFLNRPPIIADVQLKNRATALLPRGITYVSGANSFGAKPVYQITPPIAEMGADILDIRQRIREILHNDLFKMISQLDTVRSATEIDARREEKLVLLGPVLERFENEALDPAITRIFAIMGRKGLLPETPPELSDVALEIQFVSVLSDAQRAVGTAAHERFAQFVGNLAAVDPEVLDIPAWDGLIRDYAERIGVPGIAINDRETTDAKRQARQQKEQIAQAAEVGPALTGATKQLSETDVGGGENALQQLLGGS